MKSLVRIITIVLIAIFVGACSSSQNNSKEPTNVSFPFNVEVQSDDIVWAYNNWNLKSLGIKYSKDFGSNWLDIETNSNLTLHSSLFFKGDKIWLYNQNQNKLVSSSDYGANWSDSPLPILKENNLTLFWLDDHIGWIKSTYHNGLGYGSADIFLTNDGGQSWKLLSGTDLGSIPIDGLKSGIIFKDQYNGWINSWILTDHMIWLYATQDGGITWNKQILPFPPKEIIDMNMYMVEKPQLFNEGSKVAVKVEYENHVILYFYENLNFDNNWRLLSSFEVSNELHFVSDVKFVDTNNGWFHNGSYLYRTKDGGENWYIEWQRDDLLSVVSNLKSASITDFQIENFDLKSELLGILIIRSNQQDFVLRTSDGGENWNIINPKY